MENQNDFNFELFEDNEREKASPKQREKRTADKKKRQRIVNAVFFGVLGIIIAAAAVLAAPFFFAKYNPERYAVQYIEAVISKDYGAVYDKSEGRKVADFGRDEFIAACEKSPELISISEGEITDFAVQKYGAPVENVQNMLVTFTNGEGETGTYIFPMLQISNGFWKYDEYAAVLTFDIICRAKIYAPMQTAVYLNGEELSEDICQTLSGNMAGGESFSYLEFSLDPMLAGEYTLKAENAYCEPYEQSCNINKLNCEIYIGMDLSEDGKAQLISAAESNITTFINGAAENSVDPSSLPLTDRFAKNGFEETAKALEKELYAGVDYISVSDFAISNIALTNDFEKAPRITAWNEARITLDLTFDYTYKLNNSKYAASPESRNGRGYAIITYTCANGKWQMDDFSIQAKF